MSYFMPNILANKDMYEVWVKKNLGNVFWGSKCSKMLKNAIFCILTPKNTPQIFFLTKLYTFPCLLVCLA